MNLFFAVIILFIGGGSLFLWISGFLSGRTQSTNSVGRSVFGRVAKERDLSALKVKDLETQLHAMTEQIARSEGTTNNLRERVERDNAELDRARAELAGLRRMTLAPGGSPSGLDGEDVTTEEHDEALVQLDMERVAHRKTIEELKSVQSEVFNLQQSAPESSGSIPPGEAPVRGETVSRVEYERLKRERDRFRQDGENFRRQLVNVKQNFDKVKTEAEQFKKENEGLMERLEKWTD